MSLFSKLKKAVKKGGTAIKKVSKKIPGKKLVKAAGKTGLFKKALKIVPIVGTAYSAYDIAKEFIPKKTASFSPPMLKGMAGLPVLAAGTGGTGIIPKGVGGSWQMPWNDPSTPAILKQFALDDEALKTYFRAPKGYVVVRDASGRPYPLLKWAAQRFGMWKPPHKPPISVGDYQALKRADRTVKKVKKIMVTVTRVDRSTGKSGKVIIKKRRAA